MKLGRRSLAACLVAGQVAAVWAAPAPASMVTLRVVNAVEGPIQARLGDAGAWVKLGAVTRPAIRTAEGFAASRWAPPGAVAATAVHGIRIKVSGDEFGPMFSIVPHQFDTTPAFYGGHVPGDSGIRTDVGAGAPLFRECAPFTGSPVYLETAGGEMPLPADYRPAVGDVLLIRSRLPADAPSHIVFENHKGGAVTAEYEDGTVRRIGSVSQPVLGIGRFDGTSWTGPGRVNTNHPGVITIGTAPYSSRDTSEGAAPERRGGFMISPSGHVADQAEGMPQVMGVAPMPGEPGWEGRFPLFLGAISPCGSCFAEVSIDDGPWEPVPVATGRVDDAFTAKGLSRLLAPREVKRGVTAVRLSLGAPSPVLPPPTKTATREPTGGYDLVRGVYSLHVKGAAEVSFLVDGSVRASSNDPEYTWRWDTRGDANGRHYVEVRSIAPDGRKMKGVRRVVVDNR